MKLRWKKYTVWGAGNWFNTHYETKNKLQYHDGKEWVDVPFTYEDVDMVKI